MIYQINKYHKTAEGETSSAEQVKTVNAKDCFEKAVEKHFRYCADYMADKSVLAWKVTVICPSDMTIKMVDGYTREVEQVEEPVEE